MKLNDHVKVKSNATSNTTVMETTVGASVAYGPDNSTLSLPEVGLKEENGPLTSDRQTEKATLDTDSTSDSSAVLEDLPKPSFLTLLHTRNGTNMRGFLLTTPGSATSTTSDNPVFFSVLYVCVAVAVLLAIIVVVLVVSRKYFRRAEKEKVIVVRSLKNEREEFRRKEKGEGKVMDRPKTLPANMTLNSESNLQTVKVKTLAITVRNNLEDEGTEV